jgi:TatD DNase family protein
VTLPPIDAHAHVDARVNARDLSALRAVVLAVTGTLDEWRVAATRSDDLTLWGVGCHPGLPAAVDGFDADRFADELASATFVGEVGLDRRARVPFARQREVFAEILTAVTHVPRPVSIHSTAATKAVLDLLETHPIATPILHWWRGTPAETMRAIELGCYFSLNGHEAASPRTMGLLPLERVLTETDFPHSMRYDAAATRPAATATIEAALMAQHGLSVVELRARLWDTLRAAFAPAVTVVPTSRRVGRLLRGEATTVED